MPSEPEAKFWRLLAAYETLTSQEAVAIGRKDLARLQETLRLKTAIFSEWRHLGAMLHMRRETDVELNRRLTAIAALERENLLGLETIQHSARRRLEDLSQILQRLHAVQRQCHEVEPIQPPTRHIRARA